MGLFNLFILTIFCLTASSGCTPHKEHVSSLRRARLSPLYDESACVVPKTRGKTADLSKASVEESETSRFFGKRYNASFLRAVLSTSAVATGQFVSHLLDGRVYRVQHDYVAGKKVCPTFTELPKAPDDLLGVWETQTAKVHDGALSGLYFEYCLSASECDDRAVKNPTILIDDVRDRWTLVHEMMHYNFDRERKRDPESIGDSRLERDGAAAKEAIYENYLRYSELKDHDSLFSLETQASWLIRTFTYQTLVRGLFEEIATEGLLLDEYSKGDLENVSPLAAENAALYLNYAAKEGAARFDEVVYNQSRMSFSLNSLARFIRNEAEQYGWPDIASQAAEDQQFITAFLNKAGGFAAEARRNFPAHDNVATGLITAGHSQPLQDHIHALPGVRIFERWKRR